MITAIIKISRNPATLTPTGIALELAAEAETGAVVVFVVEAIIGVDGAVLVEVEVDVELVTVVAGVVVVVVVIIVPTGYATCTVRLTSTTNIPACTAASICSVSASGAVMLINVDCMSAGFT